MLKQILHKLTNTDAIQWEEHLGPCLWAYRTTIGVNGFTPYFLQYGREPGIPQTMLHSSFGVENDATERYQQLADAFHTAAKYTEEACIIIMRDDNDKPTLPLYRLVIE